MAHLMIVLMDVAIEEIIIVESRRCNFLTFIVSIDFIIVKECLDDSYGGGAKPATPLAGTLVNLGKMGDHRLDK
jgi:hypothetical protein